MRNPIYIKDLNRINRIGKVVDGICYLLCFAIAALVVRYIIGIVSIFVRG